VGKIHNKGMKKEIFIKAYAKVNLLLDVLRRREDGYHELEGIMQSVSLYDIVRVSAAEVIEVVSSAPLPYNNTCRRAAEAFLGDSGMGVRIIVEKRIPSEAGLGGASADAAAVLRGLNELYAGTPLERSGEELFTLGLAVGADVPFCLAGGCAAARGVGERLAPVRGLKLDLLIVKGSRGVSTGKLFSSLGVGEKTESRLKNSALVNALAAIETGDRAGLAACFENALAPAAKALAPEIDEYEKRMLEQGALGASMTGSGAAVFGAFATKEDAEKAKAAFSDCDFAQVCTTLDETESRPLVVFREAGEGDAALIAHLKLEAWKTTYRGIYPDELIDGYDMEKRTERERGKLASPDITGYIIVSRGEPCGFMLILDGEKPHVIALYLLKEFRGAGIGRAALTLAAEHARERGFLTFTLNCNAHNSPALGFYKHMGGIETGRCLGHENKREDQIAFEFDA
jgi:4-diphosphocytidyl-2-C-methyl-D-erythritol kinase